VVAMDVGQHYDFDLLGVNFEGCHVGKENLSVPTGIEQDRPCPHFYQTSEAPGCVQALVVKVIIVEESKKDGLSSGNRPAQGYQKAQAVNCKSFHHVFLR